MKIRFYRPRFINRLIAFFLGYFWIQCPICNNYFGGHEQGVSLMVSHHRSIGVCLKCTDKAKRLNKEFEKNNPVLEIFV